MDMFSSANFLMSQRLHAAKALADIALQLVVFTAPAANHTAMFEALSDTFDVRILPITQLTSPFWHNEAEADAVVLYCQHGGFNADAMAAIDQYLMREIVPPAIAIFYDNETDAQALRNAIKHRYLGIIPLLPYAALSTDINTGTMVAWLHDIRFASTALRRNRIRGLTHALQVQEHNNSIEKQFNRYVTLPLKLLNTETNKVMRSFYNKAKQWW